MAHLGTVSEVGFGLLGLAMGLGTGNISWPDSGSEECSRPLKNMRKNIKKRTKVKITNLVDNCPPVTLLGASLELEYPLLSTVST